MDGSGNRPYKADVGIEDDQISFIEKDSSADAEVVLDSKGLIVCPGFIDIHSHSDMIIPFDNRLESMMQQGITTSVLGNCGSSLAPVNEERLDLLQRDFNVFSPRGQRMNITWRSFEEYLEQLQKTRVPMNIAPLVGFGTVRISSGPAFENRKPTEEELANMKASVAEAMEAGAFGMSTGLFYPPQAFASTDEVLELAKTVAEYDGLYFSHIRGEGASVVQAVEELIRIVEESGCRGGQIAHHKIAGRPYWGTSRKTLKIISDANKRGLRIRCDQYPYNRGMTSLTSLLPPWVHEGGTETLLSHLHTDESQERIKRDVAGGIEGWENIIRDVGWDGIYIASAKTEKWNVDQGKSLQQIADEYNYSDVFLLLFEILIDEGGESTMTIESMDEADIRRIMKDRHSMIGTDGWGVSPTGAYSWGKAHPRSYGTYPRVLAKYVRAEGILKLEEAIWKMTGFPADTLGLGNRGQIREGFSADVVIFDPQTIQDTATFLDPHEFPEGIHYVIVNGEIVVAQGEQKNVFPGQVLKNPWFQTDRNRESQARAA